MFQALVFLTGFLKLRFKLFTLKIINLDKPLDPTSVGGRVPAGEQVARENMSLAENTMDRDNARLKKTA
jgi:hypothetical protein